MARSGAVLSRCHESCPERPAGRAVGRAPALKNPLPATRRALRWEAFCLRRRIERLRRRKGSLSFHAERGGPHAKQAEALSGVIGAILADLLGPAADSLEREGRNTEPLPEAEDSTP